MNTSRKIQRGNANLLRLARILEGLNPAQRMPDGNTVYDQSDYLHTCGAPACALGHWAAHNPSRWASGKRSHWGPLGRMISDKLAARRFPKNQYGYDGVIEGQVNVDDGAMLDFAITFRQCRELFGLRGCGDAGHDPHKAAAYIRNFVAARGGA